MYAFEEFIIAVYCAVDDALKVLTSGQSFQGSASYGDCAAKDAHFYGFRGHWVRFLVGM